MAAKRRRYTNADRAAFVEAVALNGQPRAVADTLGIPWLTVKDWKRKRPGFAEALDDAVYRCGTTLVASALVAARGKLQEWVDEPSLTPTKIVSEALAYVDERWGRKTLDHNLEGDDRFARLMRAVDGEDGDS